jgi:signal transduction histidine kinase
MALGSAIGLRVNVTPADRGTFVNWAPWSFAAPAVAGQAMAPAISREIVATAAAVGATTSAALSQGAGEFLANMGAMIGLFGGGYVLGGQIRRGSRRLEVAQSKAIDEGVLLAAEHERSRQLRLLHDSALQTLEAVGSRRYADHAAMQRRAGEEADRLQLELDGRPARAGSIREAINGVVREHGARGLRVDVRFEPTPQPTGVVAQALRDACHEALTNISKHAGVTQATVRIEAANEGVLITVDDAGAGFDPAIDAGFGTTQSIKGRLAEVGGWAEVSSRPRGGTRVALWGPAPDVAP